jgi:hypothetical protein
MSQGTIQPSWAAPPGPKGRFLVGNALDFSRGDWFVFSALLDAQEEGNGMTEAQLRDEMMTSLSPVTRRHL